MKKVIGLILVLALVLATTIPAFAFGPQDPPAKELDRVVPTAEVIKDRGNMNTLTVTVTEYYTDGSTIEVSATFTIHNNAAANYTVGAYNVFVDTKGNTKIRDIYIVE